jgi:zona occludens toxin
MLYVVTGANGAGKTLNTLKWVRELQLKESRPVCYNGRFDMVADFGWKKIDAKEWQAEPDGTIFLFDECHNDFPVRGTSAAVPPYVQALGEHRRRDFDFFLISQHPQNIDLFIRRLVGSPGWHRHLKRAFGADLVSVLEWNAINSACEKTSAGKTGSVKMVAFPKEVYAWYNSASLHTGKKRIPPAVWVLLGCVLLVPALGYLAFQRLKPTQAPSAPPGGASQQFPGGAPSTQNAAKLVLTRSEYIDMRAPRIAGLPQTAPVYDAVTQPTEAPFPAACVASKTKCHCYTQQATLLQVDDVMCRQIVERALDRAGVLNIYSEKTSSTGARPQLRLAVAQLRDGDVLVVYKLDRLARSLKDLLALLDQLTAIGAGFRSLTEPIDTATPTGRLMISMLGAVAEFERSLIRERTLAGQAAARARGSFAGRPALLSGLQVGELRRLRLLHGWSVKDLCEKYGVNDWVVRRVIGPIK